MAIDRECDARESDSKGDCAGLQHLLQDECGKGEVAPARWGWKEPNTHMIIDRWLRRVPDLRYVHVIRNGLDMAYSNNQNQVRFWGRHVLEGVVDPPPPRDSLRLWCLTHRRVLELEREHRERVLLLNFDHLCREPERGFETLVSCARARAAPEVIRRLARRFSPPATIGRFKGYDLKELEPEDVSFVQSLGFDTDS